MSRLPPPRLPGTDSAPWNKQSPTVTADMHHSPQVLPSDQWGLGSGCRVGSGVLPWEVLVLATLNWEPHLLSPPPAQALLWEVMDTPQPILPTRKQTQDEGLC